MGVGGRTAARRHLNKDQILGGFPEVGVSKASLLRSVPQARAPDVHTTTILEQFPHQEQRNGRTISSLLLPVFTPQPCDAAGFTVVLSLYRGN